MVGSASGIPTGKAAGPNPAFVHAASNAHNTENTAILLMVHYVLSGISGTVSDAKVGGPIRVMKDYTFNLEKTSVRSSTADFQRRKIITRLKGVFSEILSNFVAVF